MKKIIWLFISILVSNNLLAQSSDYNIFDDSYLHEIRITFEDPNFWDTLTSHYDIFYPDVPYIEADVEIDGYTIESVGVRQKGFASNFFVMGNKKPLKIDFNEFTSGQSFDNITKINLANGVGDPAIIKDKLAYDIMRFHGVPAPRVSHAKVYLNNQLWGVYALIEQVGKRYLERNFADETGNLWKSMDNTELHYQGPNDIDYPEIELKTNELENDWSKLIHFIDVINNVPNANFKDSIQKLFDVDSYLRILAVDVLSNNWDSYLDHGRNFYIYHEPKSNQLKWLPWDYNFSFDRTAFGWEDLDLIQENFDKVLTYKIMQIPEFETQYLKYMCEILEVNFTQERISDYIDKHYAVINPNWDAASNNIYNSTTVYNALYNNWLDDTGFPGPEFQGLNNFLTSRRSVISSDISDENYICIDVMDVLNDGDIVINEIMASNDSTSNIVDQNGQHEDWIEMYNNTSGVIDLTNYFLSDNKEFLKKWRLPENTEIASGAYLIVWADRDVHQNGLHTSFKLEKNGEELYLTYLDDTKLDSVVFGIQTNESSFARIPNGIGPFELAKATFSVFNERHTSIKSIVNFSFNVYPNPTESQINITLSDSNRDIELITITNISGQEIYKKTISGNENLIQLDIANFNTGLYYINLVGKNFKGTELIIVK